MELLNELGLLESAGLIRVAQVDPELEYLFRHVLVQDAAYTSLLDGDRKRLHQAVGSAVEQLYPDRLEELSATLAHHFEKAGDGQRALKYFIMAGDAALALFANQEAEDQYRRALASGCQEEERARILAGLGESLYRQGRFNDAQQVLIEAIAFYVHMGDDDQVARLYARRGRIAWYAGDQPGGLQICRQGLEALKDKPETLGMALLIHEAARACYFNGENDCALELCQRALKLADDFGADSAKADMLATYGVLPSVPEEESLAALYKAIELSEAAGLWGIAGRARHNLGSMIRIYHFDLPAAYDQFQKAVEIGRKRGVASEELISLLAGVGNLIMMGRMQEVERQLSQLEGLAASIGNPASTEASIRSVKAAIKWLYGDWEEALSLYRSSYEDAINRGDLQLAANAVEELSWSMLEMHYWDGRVDWAELERLLAFELDTMTPSMGEKNWAYCRMSIMYTRRGDLAKARDYINKAYQLINKPGNKWVELPLKYGEMELAVAEGRFDEAIAAAEMVVNGYKHIGVKYNQARGILNLVDIYTLRGEPSDLEQAQNLLREALAIFDELGARRFQSYAIERLQSIRSKINAQVLDHEKLTREMARAAQVQGSLLPESAPVLPGWQVAVSLDPARDTSGDYYDFIPLPGGRWGFVVADVTDKGASAALFMAISRSLIRTFASDYVDDPEKLVAQVNTRMLADTHSGLYVTLFYGVLDPSTGKFTYCNAGHNSPFFFNRENPGAHRDLDRTGIPLGIFDDASWQQAFIQMMPGDTLVVYTDGLIDAQNEQEVSYGEGRVLESVSPNLGKTASELHKVILSDLHDFVGSAPQYDDLTLMVLRRDEG